VSISHPVAGSTLERILDSSLSSLRCTPRNSVSQSLALMNRCSILTFALLIDVWESGSVDERAVYLLCGNADFQVSILDRSAVDSHRADILCRISQLAAHSLSIDRKIKTRLEPKTSIAMKILRQQWQAFFKKKMVDPSAPLEGQQQWLELLLEALESPKKQEEEEKKRTREPVKISLTAAH